MVILRCFGEKDNATASSGSGEEPKGSMEPEVLRVGCSAMTLATASEKFK